MFIRRGWGVASADAGARRRLRSEGGALRKSRRLIGLALSLLFFGASSIKVSVVLTGRDWGARRAGKVKVLKGELRVNSDGGGVTAKRQGRFNYVLWKEAKQGSTASKAFESFGRNTRTYRLYRERFEAASGDVA